MRAWLAVVLVVPVVAFAQSRDEEILIARSAAPPEIAKDAKVYVLDHGHYVVADPGRSGEVCMVGRPGAADFAPMCGDAEVDASELAKDRFRTEQRLAGVSKAEIERAIEEGMKTGRFREPTRPALLFMLSSTQQLTDTAGKAIGKWYPHLMVFYPGLVTNEQMGLVDSKDVNVPSVSANDQHSSVLVVIARNWVDPGPKLVTQKTSGK